MKYEDVLKHWGKDLLEKDNPSDAIELDSVYVSIETDPGWQCCNGQNEGCYCSMAEGASSYVEITGRTDVGGYRSLSLNRYMEFVDIIRELDDTARRISE